MRETSRRLHAICGRAWVALLAGCGCLGATSAGAESSARPPFELALFAGPVHSTVVVEEYFLHSPPSRRETERHYDARSLELAGRLEWSPRTATLLSVGQTDSAEMTETFERPDSPPFPGSTYLAKRSTSRRIRFLTLLQSWTFRPGARARPFVEGGVELRRSSDGQTNLDRDYVDPSGESTLTTAWTSTRAVLLVGGGLRLLASRRSALTIDVTYRLLGPDEPEGELSLRWRAGLGFSF